MTVTPHELSNNKRGLCARLVCAVEGNKHENMRHVHSNYLYCRACAKAINRVCGEQLVVEST